MRVKSATQFIAEFENVLQAIWNELLRLKTEKKLENVAIANALQLEAARATPVISRFNYDAMPSWSRRTYPSIAVL